MDERHEHYIADLRARHVAELEDLRSALAGRRLRVLREIKRRHAAAERETERILTTIRREGRMPQRARKG